MDRPYDKASFWHSGLPRACITPIVITQPDFKRYPGMSSGTGFFVRRASDVYLFTALHCLEIKNPPMPFDQTAKLLTIPIRTVGRTKRNIDFVNFYQATQLAEDPNHSTFLDAVALRVLPELRKNHQHLLSRSVKLPPSGLWLDKYVETDLMKDAMEADEPITFVVMGYPNEGTNTSISYAQQGGEVTNILLQSASFTGHLRRSPLDHHLKLDHISWTGELTGFSGSPVFVQFRTPHGKQSALAGMLVLGDCNTGHFISVSTLVQAVDAGK